MLTIQSPHKVSRAMGHPFTAWLILLILLAIPSSRDDRYTADYIVVIIIAVMVIGTYLMRWKRKQHAYMFVPQNVSYDASESHQTTDLPMSIPHGSIQQSKALCPMLASDTAVASDNCQPPLQKDKVRYSSIEPRKTLPEKVTFLASEEPTPPLLPTKNETGNIEEMERKIYSNCDQDSKDVTEKEGDGSVVHVSDEVSGKAIDHLPEYSLGVSQPQDSQCPLSVSLPKEFRDYVEESFHQDKDCDPQEFIEGPLVQCTAETTVVTRSPVIHIVTGSVIYIRDNHNFRTHAPSSGCTYSIQLPTCEVPDTQGNQNYLTCVDPALQNRDVHEVLVEDTNQGADDEYVGFESAEESNGASPSDSASSPSMNDMVEVCDKG